MEIVSSSVKEKIKPKSTGGNDIFPFSSSKIPLLFEDNVCRYGSVALLSHNTLK